MFWNREPEKEEKEAEEQEEQILLVNMGEEIVGRQKNDQGVSLWRMGAKRILEILWYYFWQENIW